MYQSASSPPPIGLRRHPSNSATGILSAFPTDEFGPHPRSPPFSTYNNGSDNEPHATDPWKGAFTKSFMNENGNSRKIGDAEDNNCSKRMMRPYSLISKLVAEFIGTLVFVFIGSLSGVHSNQLGSSLLHSALAHGLAIFVLITALGHVSGGHFNPAVSLGIALSGKMNPLLVLLYWTAQLAGGFGGAILTMLVTSKDQYASIVGGATIVPASTQLWYQALIVEGVLSAFLVLTVLTCAVDTQQNVLAPLAIGMSITGSAIGGASISGTSLNPARSFGPALVTYLFQTESMKFADPLWSLHWVYWAGPLAGAVIAAMLYRILFGRNGNRLLP